MPENPERFVAFLRGIFARPGEYLDMCFLNKDVRPRAITLQTMCRTGRCGRFWQAEIFSQNAETPAAFRQKVRAIGQASDRIRECQPTSDPLRCLSPFRNSGTISRWPILTKNSRGF
jgi:hypothetical protein